MSSSKTNPKRQKTPEDDPSDNSDSTSQLGTEESQSPPSLDDSRERSKINLFTEEEEADLVEWYKEQVFLYDKESKDHKNPDKKTRVMDEKGRSMRPPVKGGQIATWIDTNRTRYGKLTIPKSGSGRTTLSARDRWILEKFAFLKGHIRRVPQRQSQKFGTQPEQQPEQGTSTQQGEQGQEAEEEIINEPEDVVGDSTPSATAAPTVSTTATPAAGRGIGPGKRKRTTTDDDTLIEQVLGHLSESRDVSQRLQRLENRTAQQHKVHLFYEYMESLTVDMDPVLWLRYTARVMELGNQFMAEDGKRKSGHGSPIKAPPMGQWPGQPSAEGQYLYYPPEYPTFHQLQPPHPGVDVPPRPCTPNSPSTTTYSIIKEEQQDTLNLLPPPIPGTFADDL